MGQNTMASEQVSSLLELDPQVQLWRASWDHTVSSGTWHVQTICLIDATGLKGIVVAAATGTAETPRAHITNMAALECVRDIGLEDAFMKVATPNENMEHTRWCPSMAGEEYARIYSWGNDPKRHGDYDAASPCKHVDIPQTELEPILVKYATHNGFHFRWDTSFVSFERKTEDCIVTEVRDDLTNLTYKIQSKYLFGCDGGRSPVMKQLSTPFIKKPGQGLAINILMRCDLSQLVQFRMGNLHWCVRPFDDHPPWGMNCLVRMVKPWTEWMFIVLPDPTADMSKHNPTPEEYLARCKEWIGDDSIPAEIIGISKWYINEMVAEHYSDSYNVHCLGDAVHRHPPFNGLGSNTCIQDAYNLAWKVSLVEQGLAGKELLKSYSPERQPVGLSVVTRANQGLRDHTPVWKQFGMLEPTVEERKAIFDALAEPTSQGSAKRKALREAIQGTANEFHGLGVEMNQRYESNAVYLEDEKEPRPPLPQIQEHEITTYPGSRLPHAWLNTRVPQKPFSTQDIAGNRKFCLLTGLTGQPWKDAAINVGKALGLDINAYSIGWQADFEDMYGDWARRSEIEEDGCVLIRPDRFVAWRSKGIIDNAEEKLRRVMTSILSLRTE